MNTVPTVPTVHTVHTVHTVPTVLALEKTLNQLYQSVDETGVEYCATADSLLQECNGISLAFLSGEELDISTEDLFFLYEFLSVKSEYLRVLKLTKDIDTGVSLPITALLEDLKAFDAPEFKKMQFSNETMYHKISTDIDFIQHQLTFNFAVFGHILNDREYKGSFH